MKFVLIGGLAALAQGSPFPTEDVDVTPETSPENLDKLSAALRALGARIRTHGVEGGLAFDHDGESARRRWRVEPDHAAMGDLDLSVRARSAPMATPTLCATRKTPRSSASWCRSPRLADIIRSKQAANRPKDQRVLPTLREILANRDLDTK